MLLIGVVIRGEILKGLDLQQQGWNVLIRQSATGRGQKDTVGRILLRR